ncbi:ATP-dependent RNA helicase HrpB [Citrobacter freundii]|nr:ATP-dependent RNA helicase HrpB [Citrobacter freundii]
MTSLPVAAVVPELLTALDASSQVLLMAPTGAGKSTWLPLRLLEHRGIKGRIILLEPRRLAARNVAQRLAELLNGKAWRDRGVSHACAKLRRAADPP